jgi:hypothetical protein
MSRQIQPRATEFLTDRPHGVPVWQLAEFLGSSIDTTVQALRRMEARGEVVKVFESDVFANAMWARSAKATPPIFRAMETLRGMQEVARQRLVKQPLLEAA